ncbi:MAG: type II toxin-antitoxin system mRNA interferase toxin, RelE/StbE family [Sulfurovum sp.]|nr:MAG: type II toxin-antitoxin system mRNA interferase toxin, RelE/StbE family [Sulfurovum sp.]
MNIKRHKHFRKDEMKVKLTDEQYAKRIKYLSCLLKNEPLPSEAKDHSLMGEYKGFREFHLGGDMLMIYTIVEDTLYLQRIGTHSQLFK